MNAAILVLATVLALAAAGCAGDRARVLTFSGSAVGAEGEIIRRQLARFAALHPEIPVELRITPDAADQRHQLYVQWLNARVPEPDVLQLDIIWTAEFAAAGWIHPVPLAAPERADFFPAALQANEWDGVLHAIPWFVDAGLLYRRTDLVPDAPASLAALRQDADRAVAGGGAALGLVWQGARYEGLVTVFLEHLTAFGGRILDEQGAVVVDQPAAARALTFMRDAIHASGLVPAAVLTWQEEQVRFAFQNGGAVFMRNWPYAWTLLQDGAASRIAGNIAISAFPAADGGRPAAALGGGQLAISRYTQEPELAAALVTYLTAPAQMLERARVASQLPARRSLYDSGELAAALPIPLDDIRSALEAAVARPVTPVYSELSELLQVHLHRALTNQEEPAAALHAAAAEIRTLLARTGLDPAEGTP